MAGIHIYFQAMTLPPAEETDIGEKATKAANAAVQHLVTRKGKKMLRQVEKASVSIHKLNAPQYGQICC